MYVCNRRLTLRSTFRAKEMSHLVQAYFNLLSESDLFSNCITIPSPRSSVKELSVKELDCSTLAVSMV